MPHTFWEAGRTLSAMTDPAKRERAALDVLALLPEWWALGPTSYDPGTVLGDDELMHPDDEPS